MIWLKDYVKKLRFHYRGKGYRLLAGHGVEVGALHQPAPVPRTCRISYADVMSKAEAMVRFPEIPPHKIVDVDYIVDIDQRGLSDFADESQDFIVFNHVIEHVANPVHAVKELFRVVRPGGMVVISAPDKNYTYDRKRPLTPFAHLLAEYQQGVADVTDDHYLDFIRAVEPRLLGGSEALLQQEVNNLRNRREHAHVWDSVTFREFLDSCFELFGIHPRCLYEVGGRRSRFEYFSVWQK